MSAAADKEIAALRTIATALDGLTTAQSKRVLAWAQERYVDGDREGVYEVFRTWTDLIAKRAHDIGIAPGELEAAVLALTEQVEKQREPT